VPEPSTIRERLVERRGALAIAVCVSLAVHLAFAFGVDQVLSAPSIDIEFQLPMDVELGLTEELALAGKPVAPLAAPESAPEPPSPLADPLVPAPDEPKKPKRKPKPKPETDAGAPEAPRGATTDAGAGGTAAEGSRLPPGAQIAVRVDMTRIRKSPIADDMRAFVAAIPDWKALLDGSGIDPITQLDRLLIATPNLQREKIVVAGRYLGDRAIVDSAVNALAAARGIEARWTAPDGVEVAPWANADATARVIALVGPQHFTISRAEDLPTLLAIARARATGKDVLQADKAKDAAVPTEHPADALLSMEPDEGLSLEVDGVASFVKRARRGIPTRLRIAALEVPGPAVAIRAQLWFDDSQGAADALRFWDAVRTSYSRNALVNLLGLAQPLQEATLELDGSVLRANVLLSVEQTRLILGYVREMLTPPVPAPAPTPRPAPLRVMPATPEPATPAPTTPAPTTP
jgi:hypothetical protein